LPSCQPGQKSLFFKAFSHGKIEKLDLAILPAGAAFLAEKKRRRQEPGFVLYRRVGLKERTKIESRERVVNIQFIQSSAGIIYNSPCRRNEWSGDSQAELKPALADSSGVTGGWYSSPTATIVLFQT
jgi:hypothetical protein